MQYLEQVPDTIKVAAAISAPALTFLGISVEQWTFVLSAVVSILFIIEKLPTFIERCRSFMKWIKNVKRKKQENP